jgi:NMD protein affecting ribosome stability and mRNA decay
MAGGRNYAKNTRKKAIDSEKDSYLLKIAPGDMAECRGCAAVYHGKRWYLRADMEKLKKTKGLVAKKLLKVLCPACQKKSDHFAGGFVTLEGNFLKEHKDEIMNLIKNKETLAMRHNPLDRIMSMDATRGRLEITTTTEKLAQRIGQILEKTFGGDVEYKWSSDVKLARVHWKRNDGERD